MDRVNTGPIRRIKASLDISALSSFAGSGRRFEVTTDASEDTKTVRAVLTQNGHPVVYESTKLNTHQLNYSVHDKEMCAIMHALERWRPFLLGRHFKVYTDKDLFSTSRRKAISTNDSYDGKRMLQTSNCRAHPTVNISRVQIYFGPRPQLVTEPSDDDTDTNTRWIG
jgi:hypothetical protein